MFTYGALIIPADIVSAINQSIETKGTLGGATLESENVFVSTFAHVAGETKVCDYFREFLSHQAYEPLKGTTKDTLLEWRKVSRGFLAEHAKWNWFDSPQLAIDLDLDPTLLSDKSRIYICVIEPDENGPKVKAFYTYSKGGQSRLLPVDSIVVPETQNPFVRLPKQLTDVLVNKRVAIIGLGSGGAEIALNLACSGVGHLDFFDDDRIHPENYIRHALNRRNLGRTKVAAIADELRERSLPTDVSYHEDNVLYWANDFRDRLDEDRPNLIVCATDSRDSRRFVNLCAIQFGIDMVMACMLDAGRIGEVILVMPKKTACYECVRLALSSSLAPPDLESGSTIPYVDISEGIPQSAVQRFDIQAVASLATRTALQVLDPEHYPCIPADYLVWGREARQDISQAFNFQYPLSVNFVPISRRSDCPACGEISTDLDGISVDDTFRAILARFDKISN